MLKLPPYTHRQDHAANRGSPAACAPLPEPAQMLERCQGFLLTLAELGTDLARQIHRTATVAADQPGADAGPALDRASEAFDRTATGVRRTVLLIEKLARPAPSVAPGASSSAEPGAASAPATIRQVQDALRTHGDRAESLRSELPERLETVERAEDLGTRPADQILAAILHDLGVSEPDQPPDEPLAQTQARELAFAPLRREPLRNPPHLPLTRTPAIPDG